MRLSRLTKRLMPLYATKFILNLVFWYSIEKLFMTDIGFNAASIGFMVALYSVVSFTVEIPSGILADRWSRKGVLMLAAISLSLCGLISGLSGNMTVFLIGSVFWGIYDALTSGTYESIVYDTLLEEEGNAKKYERISGMLQLSGSVGLVISAIAGGLIGQYVGLRETFLISAPIALLAIAFMASFKEPSIHKQTLEADMRKHIAETFSSVFRNKHLIWILISLFAVSLVSGLIMEMSQLWLIALAVPATLFGLTGAFQYSTFGLSGVLARYFSSKRVLVSTLALMAAASVTLALSRNAPLTILAAFTIASGSLAAIITLTRQLNDHLPSRVRAGAGSALNTVGRLIFVPLVLGFGALANSSSIFMASWVIFGLILIGLATELRSDIRLPGVRRQRRAA